MRLGGWIVLLTAMILFLTVVGVDTQLTGPLGVMGIVVSSETSEITDADIENSTFWSKLFNSEEGNQGWIYALGVTGIVIIGLFAKGYDVSIVLAPIIVYIGGVFISSFWKITLYVQGFGAVWLTTVVGLILSVLSVGFVMACIDYFGGR